MVLAYKFAMGSDLVSADMVEVTEFPHLGVRYQVQGVPHIVINEVIRLEGAVPESVLLSHVMKVQDDKEMARLRAATTRSVAAVQMSGPSRL